jgi:hypothetical protein
VVELVKETTPYVAATVAQVPEEAAPPIPAQVQVNVPVILVKVPAEQASVPVGAISAYLPFLEPQRPETGAGGALSTKALVALL